MLCKEREEVVGDWASGLLMSKGWERRTAWMGVGGVGMGVGGGFSS